MSNLIDMTAYDTDKGPLYREVYESLFAPLRERPIKLFEVGVYHGGSLLLWRDYFRDGLIVGLDMNAVGIDDDTGRIRFYQGRQEDTSLLDRIGAETAPGGFDIIIDDASHIGELTRTTFWHLFDRHLRPGGLYIIEDWGTGYWKTWPDGKLFGSDGPSKHKSGLVSTLLGREQESTDDPAIFHSHRYGMVGFVKQLVDECAMGDITAPGRGISPPRGPKIRSVTFSQGQCVVRKVAD